MRRWCHRCNVSPRALNLRYKIPRGVFLSRLRMLWSNIIIVRALYEQFYTDSLRFVGFDQKPLWFNSIAEERTLTYEGQPMVGVAENVSASRARFTAMTHCRSWVESCAPPIALLFKIGEAACSLDNLRESLVCKGRTLIQGGTKGSYRLSQVLEFLTWVLTGLQPERPVCVLLDWFAPHLDESVDKLCNERGHAVLRIGGGLTPAVQVPDTHAHRPYSLHYRELEKSAAQAAWDTRPGSLLECSRQAVPRALKTLGIWWTTLRAPRGGCTMPSRIPWMGRGTATWALGPRFSGTRWAWMASARSRRSSASSSDSMAGLSIRMASSLLMSPISSSALMASVISLRSDAMGSRERYAIRYSRGSSGRLCPPYALASLAAVASSSWSATRSDGSRSFCALRWPARLTTMA